MTKRLLPALLIALGLVVAGCGSTVPALTGSSEGEDLTTEDYDPVELELQNLALRRADLELSASAGPLVDGQVEVTVSVRSLDKESVIVPRVELVLTPGVSVGPVPQGCEFNGSGLVCILPELFSGGRVPTDPQSVDVVLLVDAGAVDSAVTMTVTSPDNPLSNDPDPTNNTITVNLDGQTQR